MYEDSIKKIVAEQYPDASADAILASLTLDRSEPSPSERLLSACHREDAIECMRLIEEDQCDLTHKDVCGATCLHHACSNGWTEIVKVLLERLVAKNLTPTMTDDDGTTALFHASTEGHTDIVTLLLEAYIPNEEDMRASFSVACFKDHAGVVELLLSHSVLTTELLSKCCTEDHTLHYACKDGNEDVIRLLLSRLPKALRDCEDDKGRTARSRMKDTDMANRLFGNVCTCPVRHVCI